MESILKNIAGFASAVAAILIWWISRLLSDKRDIIKNSVDIEHLQKKQDEQDKLIERIQQDIKENRKDFEHYKDKQADNY